MEPEGSSPRDAAAGVFSVSPSPEAPAAPSEPYRVWKKNSPYLWVADASALVSPFRYDVLLTHALDWPSLTVQFLPGKEMWGRPPAHRHCSVNNNGKMDYYEKTVLLGTNTDGKEPNCVKLARVQVPNSVYDESSLDDSLEYGQARMQLTIYMRLIHEGEVNRARAMPQNSFLLATKSVCGDILVFDTSKHPCDPQGSECRPQLRLRGHSEEGFGLAWSPMQRGLVASGSNDQKICLWDIESPSAGSAPLRTIRAHHSVVEDVCFHHQSSKVLFSVSDEGLIVVSDLRSDSPGHRIPKAHAAEINSVNQSPLDEFLFAVGSSDRTISVRDLRNPTLPLFVLSGHESEIYRVEWSPTDPRLLLSSCTDGSVRMWDVCRQDANGGTIFTHLGHQSITGDISWSESEPMTVASVSEDNVFCLWQPSKSVYASLYSP